MALMVTKMDHALDMSEVSVNDQSATQSGRYHARMRRMSGNYIPWAVTLLFLAVPFAIPAIYYAAKAQYEFGIRDDPTRGKRFNRRACLLITVGISLSFVAFTGMAVWVILCRNTCSCRVYFTSCNPDVDMKDSFNTSQITNSPNASPKRSTTKISKESGMSANESFVFVLDNTDLRIGHKTSDDNDEDFSLTSFVGNKELLPLIHDEDEGHDRSGRSKI